MSYGVFLWKISPRLQLQLSLGSGEGLHCLPSPPGLCSNLNVNIFEVFQKVLRSGFVCF